MVVSGQQCGNLKNFPSFNTEFFKTGGSLTGCNFENQNRQYFVYNFISLNAGNYQSLQPLNIKVLT